MKAWLPGEHEYTQIIISPDLQRQLQGENKELREFLVCQITKVASGIPTCWRWEREGDGIHIAAAI